MGSPLACAHCDTKPKRQGAALDVMHPVVSPIHLRDNVCEAMLGALRRCQRQDAAQSTALPCRAGRNGAGRAEESLKIEQEEHKVIARGDARSCQTDMAVGMVSVTADTRIFSQPDSVLILLFQLVIGAPVASLVRQCKIFAALDLRKILAC